MEIMEYPEILFKYREVNEFTLMSVINRSVWFSDPSSLNDPFDCQIKLTDEIPTKKEFEKLGINQGKKIISALSTACFDGEKLSETYIKEIIGFKNHIENNLETIGILSLSSMNNNTTMWSHYAGSHTGICIGYNSKKLFPKNKIEKILHNVDYLPASEIDFNVFDLYTQCCFNQDKNEYRKIIDNIVATKTDDWAYEKEWRLVNGNKGSYSIGDGAIVSISFGLKATLDTKLTIRNLLANVPMIFYQMVRSKNGLGVEAEHITKDSKYWSSNPE
jgi:hypothetical protein